MSSGEPIALVFQMGEDEWRPMGLAWHQVSNAVRA